MPSSHTPAVRILLSAALACAASCGLADNTFEQRVGDFALARVEDARRLIEGPRPASPPAIDPAAGCRELYRRRVTLQRALDDRNPAYWDDPRNQAAVFLGTVWTPAFYFLGYSAVTGQLEAIADGDPRVEIDALRQASAALRCFEK